MWATMWLCVTCRLLRPHSYLNIKVLICGRMCELHSRELLKLIILLLFPFKRTYTHLHATDPVPAESACMVIWGCELDGFLK